MKALPVTIYYSNTNEKWNLTNQPIKAHLHDIHFEYGTPKFWHAGQ